MVQEIVISKPFHHYATLVWRFIFANHNACIFKECLSASLNLFKETSVIGIASQLNIPTNTTFVREFVLVEDTNTTLSDAIFMVNVNTWSSLVYSYNYTKSEKYDGEYSIIQLLIKLL